MLYLNQLDYPHIPYITRTELSPEEQEYGKTTTIKTSGCGLCSAVMVAHLLLPNCTFTLEDALQLAYDTQANIIVGTRYKRFGPAFAEKLELVMEMTNDPQEVLRCLRTGGAVVANSGGDKEGHIGVFTHGGHYVVAFAEEPDGRIAILDPSYCPGKYDEEGRQGLVEMKHGVIALCSMETLAADCSNRDPAYFLFHRA